MEKEPEPTVNKFTLLIVLPKIFYHPENYTVQFNS